jgi:hypothetical protein
MDIENLREFDIDLGNNMTRSANCGAFEIGDHVVIEEKFDGSCSSVSKNPETGILEAYSRKQHLDFKNTLNGFYEYVETLNPVAFAEGIIVFGEWSGKKNKIIYNKENTGKWYVFDMYDVATQSYLPYETVKTWCDTYGFTCIHLLYDGEFRGWDHVRTFLQKPNYGDIQEGCVIKNQSKLKDKSNRQPYYLKIVNDEFKESMKIRQPRERDSEVEAAKAQAEAFAEQIVTQNRAEKILLKLRDEGILNDKIIPEDMKTIVKHLPKRMYDDCVKEEPEIVRAMGEYAGKSISARTMQLARALLL